MNTILCALAGLVKGESKMEGGFFGTKPGDKWVYAQDQFLRKRKAGMTYKNVEDNERAELSPQMVEEIFFTGVKKMALFFLLRIHSEREDCESSLLFAAFVFSSLGFFLCFSFFPGFFF
jgi:hypothetical protein